MIFFVLSLAVDSIGAAGIRSLVLENLLDDTHYHLDFGTVLRPVVLLYLWRIFFEQVNWHSFESIVFRQTAPVCPALRTCPVSSSQNVDRADSADEMAAFGDQCSVVELTEANAAHASKEIIANGVEQILGEDPVAVVDKQLETGFEGLPGLDVDLPLDQIHGDAGLLEPVNLGHSGYHARDIALGVPQPIQLHLRLRFDLSLGRLVFRVELQHVRNDEFSGQTDDVHSVDFGFLGSSEHNWLDHLFEFGVAFRVIAVEGTGQSLENVDVLPW